MGRPWGTVASGGARGFGPPCVNGEETLTFKAMATRVRVVAL